MTNLQSNTGSWHNAGIYSTLSAKRAFKPNIYGVLGNMIPKLSKVEQSRIESNRKKRNVARYKLQDKIQELFKKYTKGEFRRIERCKRVSILPKGDVTISHTAKGNVYNGLETCGNGKLCPVCASRIATKRGNEIKELCNVAYKDGKRIVMITLTHPHKAGNRLAESLKMQSKAVQLFMGGKGFELFKKSVGFVGRCELLK